ncbi:VanZ family protein [Ornithinibacillus xuwenensis]|uniref:VanZ family protein n=1 Tax=Ornithinibacillus xuwenensis TaxID=3144668 RepID=A0ABU9XJF2_9BACI
MKYINEIPVFFILISIACYVWIRLIYYRKKPFKIYKLRELAFIILIAYVESLLYLTIFPSTNMVSQSLASINVVPFDTINLYLNFTGDKSLSFINLLGNVIVFVPIGIFPFLFWKRVSFIQIIVLGLGSTFFIEMMQLILSINGIISRSFDVDDLILNTLGVIIGYFFGLLVKGIYYQLRN